MEAQIKYYKSRMCGMVKRQEHGGNIVRFLCVIVEWQFF